MMRNKYPIFICLLVFTIFYVVDVQATTIMLQNNVTENLADGDLSRDSNCVGIQTKWNISMIPAGQVISYAVQCHYITSKVGTVDTDLTYWRVDNQTWTESTPLAQLQAAAITNETNTTWSTTPASSTWVCANITNVIQTDYALGNKYSSVRYNDPDCYVKSDFDWVGYNNDNNQWGKWTTPNNYLQFASSDAAILENRPYLNITYSSATVLSEAKNIINNTQGATPFYHNGTTINYQCNNMNMGDSCIASFWVNATGTINSTYQFYAIASSDNVNVVQTQTDIIM
jgi:hypothetical protein